MLEISLAALGIAKEETGKEIEMSCPESTNLVLVFGYFGAQQAGKNTELPSLTIFSTQQLYSAANMVQ